jgi:hypothetical protein
MSRTYDLNPAKAEKVARNIMEIFRQTGVVIDYVAPEDIFRAEINRLCNLMSFAICSDP